MQYVIVIRVVISIVMDAFVRPIATAVRNEQLSNLGTESQGRKEDCGPLTALRFFSGLNLCCKRKVRGNAGRTAEGLQLPIKFSVGGKRKSAGPEKSLVSSHLRR